MEHLEVPQFLALLVIILTAAKVFGGLAARFGQPAVLGELIAGVVLGASVLGWVDPKTEAIHLLSELGVIVLLFAIGLETDLRKLMQVGWASLAVALIGVVLPFALGYAVCKALGLENIVAIVAGAALTATSVGITARVLSDLGRLQDRESQIVLGAAVIDDVVGLVILTIVAGLADGAEVTPAGVATTTGIAFGFLLATLLVGQWVLPPLFKMAQKIDLPGTNTVLAFITALALAWLADRAGSALIIGAFAAGVLLARLPQSHEIEKGVTDIGHVFVPLFFVSVGAAVDLRAMNPAEATGRQALFVGALLIVAAVVGKFAAGYAPFWLKVNKRVIGVGMIPRGEVGLIFAAKGMATGVFDAGLFGAVTLMVMVTTFLAPPVLKTLLTDRNRGEPPLPQDAISDLVTAP